MDLGGAAAQSVVLMVIVIALTVVQISLRRERRFSTSVERRPLLTVITHLVLLLGVLMSRFGLRDAGRIDATAQAIGLRRDAFDPVTKCGELLRRC